MRPILYAALAFACLALPLAGCDDQQQTSSSAAPESVATAAGAVEEGAALPETTVTESAQGLGADDGALEGGATMENDGEAASEDTPHSDVPPPPREIFSDAACSFEDWVGAPLAEAETAAKATGRPVRVLTPDSMMTMDHSPDRINVVHEDGTVTRVWCG